ncbi:MAG: GGDEF domain-containing protein, partial [Bradyrhizobium sp.]
NFPALSGSLTPSPYDAFIEWGAGMINCYVPARNGLAGLADWIAGTCTKAPRGQIFGFGGSAIATVALINYLHGPASWFGPFYMSIICLMTWALGARIGVATGVLCMGMALWLNGFSVYQQDRFVVGWTVGTRMATAFLVIALLALFRHSYVREWTRARTDYLTGAITKRAYLEDRAQRRSKVQWRVLAYLDLDKFKEINDNLGHAEGDAVLSMFANKVMGCIRSGDALVRLGGDEFLLELWVKSEADACAAMRSIHNRLTEALAINQHELGCSVGALLIPPRAKGVSEAEIGLADQLMYRAKRDRLGEPLLAVHSVNGGPAQGIEPSTTLVLQRRAA